MRYFKIGKVGKNNERYLSPIEDSKATAGSHFTNLSTTDKLNFFYDFRFRHAMLKY